MARAAALAILLALALALPATAGAAGDTEIGIADDAALLHERDDARVARTVAEWRANGVTTVRLFAEWYKLVPGTTDVRRPAGFDPANPDDPRYGWAKLDRAIGLLRDAGLKPLLTVTGPAPVWGTSEPARRNVRWKPDPEQFGTFAAAVARRFGASVDRYVIWNEPNVPLWLQPQATCRGRTCTPSSPALYRRLVAAAGTAIEREDPGADVVIGALAPRGSALRSRNAQMRPLQFLRALGCVTKRFARIRRGACKGFRPVRADGIAHHPHSILLAPHVSSRRRDDANLADLPLLLRTIDRIQARRGFVRPGGGRFPLHLTEWGYQTRPPDRLLGISLSRQARWLQQGAFLVWRTPRVRTLVHYVWRDEPVRSTGNVLSDAGGWQSGVRTASGRAKPALRSFPVPFWADPRPGRAVLFWGQVRTRDAARVVLQVRRGGRWRRVRTARPNAFGYWSLRGRLRAASERYRFVAGRRTSAVLRVRPLPADRTR